jgi:uncharacterized protein YndB with AHSA1/START domain
MTDGEPMIEREVTVDATPERVWESLTAPEGGPSPLGDRVELDPRPGGEVWISDGERELHGEVLEALPPRRLALRWNDGEGDSIVEIDLEQVDGGTRVSVTERLVEPVAMPTVIVIDVPLVASDQPRMLAVA